MNGVEHVLGFKGLPVIEILCLLDKILLRLKLNAFFFFFRTRNVPRTSSERFRGLSQKENETLSRKMECLACQERGKKKNEFPTGVEPITSILTQLVFSQSVLIELHSIAIPVTRGRHLFLVSKQQVEKL